jgi:hypothetical protein
MVLAAKVWHYWLMLPLFFLAILVVLGVAVGYLVKVQQPRYPGRGQERARR